MNMLASLHTDKQQQQNGASLNKLASRVAHRPSLIAHRSTRNAKLATRERERERHNKYQERNKRLQELLVF